MNNHWPADWFGHHRAYRVNRALLRLEKALRGVNGSLFSTGDGEPLIKGMQFEAAALTSDQSNGLTQYPPRNFTAVVPIHLPDGLDSTAKTALCSIKGEVVRFIGSYSEKFKDSLSHSWQEQAKADLTDLNISAGDQAFLKCFDHCVGVLTRIPVYGYVHRILCEKYLASDDRNDGKNSWFSLSIERGDNKKGGLGQVKFDGKREVQKAMDGEWYEPADEVFFLGDLLPLVSFPDRHWKAFPELQIITIPIHTIHVFESSSHGPFLGWLHIMVSHWDSQKIEKLRVSMWPLLDGFGAELLDGEIQDMLANYDGTEYPKNYLLNVIHRISGWERGAENANGIDGIEYFKLGSRGNELTIRLGADGQSDLIGLKLKSKTCFLPKNDGECKFALSRFVHRVRQAYESLNAIHARTESVRLRKYERMLELLEDPLRGVSEAIDQIQRDSQKLRAILYDPARSLFDAHDQLNGLFDEGSELKVSDYITVAVAHKPISYSNTGGKFDDDWSSPKDRIGSKLDGYVVLASAIMGILGRKLELKDAKSRQGIVHRAQDCLVECARIEAFEELLADLSFLLIKSKRNCDDDALRAVLPTVFESNPGPSLEKLKTALFDPFKLRQSKWDADAIALAVKRYCVSSASAHEILKKLEDTTKPFTADVTVPDPFPVAYNSVLSLLMECASEVSRRSKGDGVTRVSLQNCGRDKAKPWVIALEFSVPYSSNNGKDRLGRKTLQNLLNEHVLSHPRDWRLSSSYAGNFQKPFLDFAGKILGLRSEWEPLPKSELCETASSMELFSLRHSSEHCRFSLIIGANPGIALVWWSEKGVKEAWSCPLRFVNPEASKT